MPGRGCWGCTGSVRGRKVTPQPAPAADAARPPAGAARAAGAQPHPPVPVARLLGNAELQRLGHGEPLQPALRDLLAPLVEIDLGRVRVHSGSAAAAHAHALGARAFTVGEHIVRGAAAPPVGDPDGQRMLAHEVAHVAHQSRAGAAARPGLAPADSAAERQAHDWAAAVSRDPAAAGPLTGPRLDGWGPAWQIGADRIVTRGTEQHTGLVGAPSGGIGPSLGSVSVRTGERIELGASVLPNVIALEYRGLFAADSHWLQFVWFELQVTNPAGTRRVSATIPTTSGTKPFTTDPAAPQWSLDSAPSNPSPFYDPDGASLRAASSIAMFDAPGGGSVGSLVQSSVAAVPDATAVSFTAHFETFLVQRGRAAYVVRWSATTAFGIAGGKATSPGIGYTVGTSERVGEVPADLLGILWRDRPGPWAIQ